MSWPTCEVDCAYERLVPVCKYCTAVFTLIIRVCDVNKSFEWVPNFEGVFKLVVYLLCAECVQFNIIHVYIQQIRRTRRVGYF